MNVFSSRAFELSSVNFDEISDAVSLIQRKKTTLPVIVFAVPTYMFLIGSRCFPVEVSVEQHLMGAVPESLPMFLDGELHLVKSVVVSTNSPVSFDS